MMTRDESIRERLAEAIAEAHDLDSGVDAVMRVIDEEWRELRESLELHARETDGAHTHAKEVERELSRLRLSVRCECPWVDGTVHLDPNCLVHQRMD